MLVTERAFDQHAQALGPGWQQRCRGANPVEVDAVADQCGVLTETPFEISAQILGDDIEIQRLGQRKIDREIEETTYAVIKPRLLAMAKVPVAGWAGNCSKRSAHPTSW